MKKELSKKQIEVLEKKTRNTLYKNATVKSVVQDFIEQLTIKEFRLVTYQPFDISEFLKNPSVIAVKKVLPLQFNLQLLLAKMPVYKNDFNNRIEKLIASSDILKEEKLEQIAFAISECKRMKLEFNPNNRFVIGLNFDWKIKRAVIPFQYLDFEKNDYYMVSDEILVRYEIFQWLESQLERAYVLVKNKIDNKPLLKWKVSKRPELKIAEFIWALERAGEIEFLSNEAKARFQADMIRLFNLRKPYNQKLKWSELNADIQKRKKQKLTFLPLLVQEVNQITQ
jgi:hypothetical protein